MLRENNFNTIENLLALVAFSDCSRILLSLQPTEITQIHLIPKPAVNMVSVTPTYRHTPKIKSANLIEFGSDDSQNRPIKY